jgi:hypothetical protein
MLRSVPGVGPFSAEKVLYGHVLSGFTTIAAA